MTEVVAREVAENLGRVRAAIADACARAGRRVDEVQLVAVSKKQPIERVRAAYDAGQRHFGENYVQELVERVGALPADATWHLIGHVQTNKAKRAIAAAVIHTIDSEKLARAIAKAVAEQGGGPKDVLVEVNTGAEEAKAGVAPEALDALFDVLAALPELSVRGLMCIPPVDDTRPHFARLRALRDALAARRGIALPELSMGMSGDFADAIAEGATIVRVGTAIFGERPVKV
ncbi:YggS family pyridoxal phosphate-dependent enzyme [Myxococcota bacterium]|nr:YggS family pyridoxal phosphate-dependent enzyme [Myxococcota bacterium]